jgi:hypothetical protein
MALARIISRSHTRSRELAFDLLARGYAVEIVSPEAVPDNLADLELRVDTDPGDQAMASPEAHNDDGAHSVSLDFLEHLKAPMGDFVRRPPETVISVGTGVSPVQGESKTRQQPVASPMTPMQPAPPSQLKLLPSPEPPKYFPVEQPTIPRPVEQAATMLLPRRPMRRDPAARWRWWTALVFASMAMLALGFGFGLRRTENTSAQVAAASPAETVAAASIDASLTSPKDSEPISSAIVPARKVSPVALADIAATSRSTTRSRAKVASRHEDDFVAPNTTTYLDKRFDPHASTSAAKGKPGKHAARRRLNSRQHRHDVIAANKTSYLDKPTRKVAK